MRRQLAPSTGTTPPSLADEDEPMMEVTDEPMMEVMEELNTLALDNNNNSASTDVSFN